VRQVCVTRYGPPGVLAVREQPDPEPAVGQVRIAVRFAGVNFSDLLARVGLYRDAPRPPCVLGYEVSGVVDAVGGGVDASLIGRRVLAATDFGGQSEFVCVPASLTFPTPEGVNDDAAAAMIVTYLTAHHLLNRLTSVQSTDTVLIHAVAGGVGTAAAQLCRIAGARVIGTASPTKHEYLREQGIAPVDYTRPDWAARVEDLTDGRGVDIALDPIGGASFRQSYRLLAPGGRLLCYGNSAMSRPGKRSIARALLSLLQMPRFGPVRLMNENRGVLGVHIGHLWGELRILRPQMEHLLELLAAGHIEPVIDRVYAFDEAAAAHERLERRQNIGKVLLRP